MKRPQTVWTNGKFFDTEEQYAPRRMAILSGNQTLQRRARYVTGADIVRISRAPALEPWHFTATAPAAAGDPTGIVLAEGRRRVSLRLANASAGCVFLIRTASGSGHCGLGDLAPVSCRIFPVEPGEGTVPASQALVSRNKNP
ncbi:hypothetical protein ACFYWY_13155 [Streptomyces sp. NPDC002870]|uniref:hypothetical protein n=1 Tax=Streptomyces sp. NPDC002870 TaxID=3364666 RepID=UPI0036B4DFDD